MSLFSTYDWWLAQCATKEKEGCTLKKGGIEFHADSLYLIDLVEGGTQIILVGNFLGNLWAFKPSTGNSSQDLLFEYNFEEPIIAMERGTMLPFVDEKQLAVLHFTKLKVFSFIMSSGIVAHGQQYYLDHVFTITFEYLAYNFVIGPFGMKADNSKETLEKEKSTWPKSNQTSICVQSMDGHLHFYAHDLNFLYPPYNKNLKKPSSVKTESQSADLKLPYKLRKSSQTTRENYSSLSELEVNKPRSITKADVHSLPSSEMSTLKENMPDNEESSTSNHEHNLECPKEEDRGDLELLKNRPRVDDFDGSTFLITKPKFIVAPFEDTFLPTMLCYIPADDFFIIFSGSWLLNCYSYRNLELQQIGHRRKKKIVPEWNYSLGQPIFYLKYLQYIFAVGTRGNLVALNPYGVQRFFIDLSFCPIAFHPYISDGKIMFLAVSEENILLVYDGGPAPYDTNDPRFHSPQTPTSPCSTKLVWSAKLPSIPVALSVGHFDELTGLIVILSEQGYVHCCYLGTSPINFMEIPRENININEEIEEDTKQSNHQAIEWNTCTSSTLKPDDAVDYKLEIILNSANLRSSKTCVNREINDEVIDMKMKDVNCNTAELNFTLVLSPNIPLNNVCLSAFVDQPFVVLFEENFISRLSEEMQIALQVTAHYCDLFTQDEIPNLRMEVMVSGYGTCNEATGKLSLLVYHLCYFMPLSTVMTIDYSIDSGKMEDGEQEIKFELVLHGQEFPSLSTLFQEFNQTLIDGKTSKLDLLLYGNQNKRIQVEYNPCSDTFSSDKCVYSISSNSLLPLYFMIIVLAERIETHQSCLTRNNVEGGRLKSDNYLQLISQTSFPLKYLIEAVDHHYKARLNILKLNHSLRMSRKQLKLAESSFLSKVRDVTTKNSEILNTILEKLFEKLMDEITGLNQEEKLLQNKKKELGLLWQIIQKMQPELPGNNVAKSFQEIICCYLPEDAMLQGWEERTEVGLLYLLKQPYQLNSGHSKIITAESEEYSMKNVPNLKDEILVALHKSFKDIETLLL